MRNPTTLLICISFALIFHFSSLSQVTQMDSMALVAIYNATDGPNWTVNDNWLSGPVGTWARVSTADNRVTEINLYSNGLSGVLPDEIGNLDSLKRLILYSNNLQGEVPASLGNCSALERLDIHVNQITGLPQELASCSRLTTIIAYRNELGDTFPDFLTSMHQLTRLELGDNGISGTIPQELSNLTNLRQLDLDRNEFDGPMPSVKDMKMLSSLYLAFNHLHGDYSDFLGDSSQIYYFTFSGNDFTGCLESKYFTPDKLKYAHIDNNNADCIDDFADFRNMALERIRCQGNRLDFDDLEPLSELQLIDFSYSPQEALGDPDTIIAEAGQTVTMTCEAGGTITTYQWFREGVAIDGANAADFEISSFDADEHAGGYYCEATNDSLPDLVLSTELITVIAEGTSGFVDNAPTKELLVYPNPTSETFRISGVEGQARLEVFDGVGRCVMSKTVFANQTVTTDGLAPGIYVLAAQNGSDRYTGKLIVN